MSLDWTDDELSERLPARPAPPLYFPSRYRDARRAGMVQYEDGSIFVWTAHWTSGFPRFIWKRSKRLTAAMQEAVPGIDLSQWVLTAVDELGQMVAPERRP